jgi:signal transduction histidine kinase/GAF domain-containing protein
VRSLDAARHLPRPALLDHVPPLLERIALVAEAFVQGGSVPIPTELAERHALERLDEGMALSHLVREFALLREAIGRLWTDGRAADRPLVELGALHAAIDTTLCESVDKYAQAHDRAIHAFDRIAKAAFGSKTLDVFLKRLLELLLEAIPAADTAAILLREGEQLRVRAAIGLEREVELGFTLAVGEGFAGTIAAERQPLFIRDAAVNSLVKSRVIRERGVRALYGVPLSDEHGVVGVAHVGSVTAHELSEQDKAIVGAMATRATSAIAQQLLREDAARLAEVLEFGDACIILDRDWRITFANANLLRGDATLPERLPDGEIVGKIYWDVWPETALPDTTISRELHRASRERVHVTFEYLHERTGRWWLGSAYPTRAQGLAIFFREVTELKRANEEAQQAVRMREEILAIVSHDLKTPLGTVRLAAGLLAAKLVDASAESPLQIIQRSVSRMDHLVRDLLDSASIQAGRFAIDRKPEDAGQLLNEAFEAHELGAREKGIQLTRDCACDGVRIHCDRDRVLQVFSNLISNALKFCRHGDSVRLDGSIHCNDVEFVVSDTGPGIPEQELPHIFEPYWSAKRHSKQGTGLGLYISKGIVEAHGGSLWVLGQPGKGAAFHFTVPLQKAE